MKKALTLILAAGLLIAALAACGSKTTPKDYDLAAMAADLKDNGGYSDIISPVVKDVAAKLYNVDAAGIADCQVYCSTKATTEEIGLFKCTDEKAAAALYEAAKARVEAAGFKTTVAYVNNSAANGTVVSTSPSGRVTLGWWSRSPYQEIEPSLRSTVKYAGPVVPPTAV